MSLMSIRRGAPEAPRPRDETAVLCCVALMPYRAVRAWRGAALRAVGAEGKEVRARTPPKSGTG
eukprot:4882553-Pleurochrysis_carterae.AAC.3